MDRVRRIVLLLLALCVLVSCGGGSDEAAPVEDEADVTTAGPGSGECPVRDHLAAEFNGRRRPGVEPPVDYAFLEARRGGCLPVRYNPCEPIPYVVNAALAPPGTVDDLHQAFRHVEEATGLRFVHEGPTDEEPVVNRQLAQPQRYGNRWAPILVAFAHGNRFRMEPTNPAGGQSFEVEGAYVTGVLIVNVDAVAQDHNRSRPVNGFGEGTTWGRVFIHELGHIVGLGHVARSDQIMFPELGVQTGRAEFHAGDLAGLRLLGRDAGCLQVPGPGGPVR
ncbi:MAG TPA: matrixin family metalloprotease [Acidimicrobiales bacterium]|nr:matrixin family metalloprotease [Acidimicrobiales bacterium]